MQLQKFLRRPAVEEVTGLGRSAIYARVAVGTFPKPVLLDPDAAKGAAVGWVEAEIIDWQKQRMAARDAKRSPAKRRARA